MGQKVNPIGLRLGINKDWQSNWYADSKDVPRLLNADLKLRKFLKTRLKDASVGNVTIERTEKYTEVTIFTSKPGVIIGQAGSEMKKLTSEVEKIIEGKVKISIVEIKQPELNASIVAQDIAKQIENRVSFRTAQKRAIRNARKAGAKGIKTLASGRLGGVERARNEGYSEGTVSLHTLRADIDYATAEADTTYGKIGIKVWIYRGETLGKSDKHENKKFFKKDNNKRNKEVVSNANSIKN